MKGYYKISNAMLQVKVHPYVTHTDQRIGSLAIIWNITFFKQDTHQSQHCLYYRNARTHALYHTFFPEKFHGLQFTLKDSCHYLSLIPYTCKLCNTPLNFMFVCLLFCCCCCKYVFWRQLIESRSSLIMYVGQPFVDSKVLYISQCTCCPQQSVTSVSNNYFSQQK